MLHTLKHLDKVLGLENGADDYIVKPFNINKLYKAINGIVENSRKINKATTPTQEIIDQ